MKRIPISSSDLKGNEQKYLSECISSNWVSSQGPYIKQFENKFSEFLNVNYSLTCSNGTTALHLALEAMEIGKEDEVIVPAFTFIASINSILYTGAKPVFVDIDPITWNIDPKKIESKISPKTKAIMFVNIYGNPADIESIKKIAHKHEILTIEDNAEALGGEYYGKKLGSFGDISCHSFFGNKLLTCGEGGMVSTNNKEFSDRIKMLRDHGMSLEKKYYHEIKGYNYRMTNLQAAVGLAQLERINIFIKERNRIFNKYTDILKNCEKIILPFLGDKDRKPINWLFTILVSSQYRDEFANNLKNKGIDNRKVFIPANKMPYIEAFNKLPVTEKISSEGISLPTFVNLKNEQVEYICKEVIETIKLLEE